MVLRIQFSIVFLAYIVGLTSANEFQPLDLFTDPVGEVDKTIQKYRALANNDINALQLEDFTSKISLPTVLAAFNTSSYSSSSLSCSASLLKLTMDLKAREKYALRVLDSWAKPESGIMEGNQVWLGRYHECINIKHENFQGQYCGMNIGLVNPKTQQEMTHFTLTTCVPDACSNEGITEFLVPLLHSLAPQLQYSNVTCMDQSSKPINSSKKIIAMAVLVVLQLLLATATKIDVVLRCKRKYSTMIAYDQHQLQPLVNEDDDSLQNVPPTTRYGILNLYVESFSIIRQLPRLLDTKRGKNDIGCLGGMRFLSMCWIIFGHTVYLSAPNYISNGVTQLDGILHSMAPQMVLNATFAVDTFFYLSGFLVVYLGMKELLRSEGKINVPLMYITRYIRLTPAYAVCLMFFVYLAPAVSDGPAWGGTWNATGNLCNKYWWTNLLYINNLYPAEQASECFGWGWYLANDMQFYLLSPLFLWLLYRYPIVGIISLLLTTLASMIITGIFSVISHQQPMSITVGYLAKMVTDIFNIDAGTNIPDAIPDPFEKSKYGPYITDIYTKPWCRIGAYAIGMLAGFFVHHRKDKIKMHVGVPIIGWLLFIASNFALVFGLYPTAQYGKLLPIGIAALYNCVSRPAWALGMAWVTIACVGGYGGLINSFLSWRGFIPLSRLTYCVYLIHPMMLMILYSSQETFFNWTGWIMLYIFTGCVMICYVLAIHITMMLEMPYIYLIKELTGRNKRKPAAGEPVVAVVTESPDANQNRPLLADENVQEPTATA